MIPISELNRGECIVYNGKPYRIEEIKSVIVASHSHAKTKVTLANVFDKSDRQTLTLPHSEKVESVDIIRRHGQFVAKLEQGRGQVMDLHSYEIFEAEIPEEIEKELNEGNEVTFVEFKGRATITEIRE